MFSQVESDARLGFVVCRRRLKRKKHARGKQTKTRAISHSLITQTCKSILNPCAIPFWICFVDNLKQINIITMSRLLINRCNLARLYHGTSAAPSANTPQRRRGSAPTVKIASKRFDLPQIQKSFEARPRDLDHNPSKHFEPFPYAVTEENKVDAVKRVLTPLHDTPYEEQLSAKESYCRNSLRTIAQSLYRSGTPVRLDIRRLPCQVNKIVPSPQTYKYRNTDELSIWYGLDGKTPTAGYNIFPLSKHGNTISVEPNGCQVIRDEAINLTNIIQEFIRNETKLGVSYTLGTQGGWRSFKIASNILGDLMLTGYLNPRTLRVREVIDDRDNFRDFIVRRCKEEGLRLVSLYYQPCPHSYCRHEDIPYELLYGEKRLTESIGQYKFLISPESYSHQSSIGAEILFDTVRKTFKDCFLDSATNSDKVGFPKPLILDARSGFGMLSIHLADLAKQVIGIEDRSMAVEDARANAELNGVNNCIFINSNLEIVMERIIEKYCDKQRQELLFVSDLTPKGLHQNVIDVVRDCSYIKKMILIISKINAPRVEDTITKLCLKGKARSLPPFAPIMATPVDVCPLTENFYTVMALERVPQ